MSLRIGKVPSTRSVHAIVAYRVADIVNAQLAEGEGEGNRKQREEGSFAYTKSIILLAES